MILWLMAQFTLLALEGVTVHSNLLQGFRFRYP